jgi:hypothetical protein
MYSLHASNDQIVRGTDYSLHAWDQRSGKRTLDLPMGTDNPLQVYIFFCADCFPFLLCFAFEMNVFFCFQTFRVDATGGYGNDWYCVALCLHQLRVYDLRNSGTILHRSESEYDYFPSSCVVDQRWIVGGWYHHGGVQIWDRRSPNVSALSGRTKSTSDSMLPWAPMTRLKHTPVCLAMDADRLFVSSREKILIFDFSTRTASSRVLFACAHFFFSADFLTLGVVQRRKLGCSVM